MTALKPDAFDEIFLELEEESKHRALEAEGIVLSPDGLVTAIAISSSKDDVPFLENTQKALKWLFFAGLRGQQLFPVLVLDPFVVQHSIEGGEGQPTPMLSVNGLLLKDLQPYNSKTLPMTLKSVYLFIMVPAPSIRAPNSSDQSKVEFSKRKPVFNKVICEGPNGEELWTSEEFQIPVYHTEDDFHQTQSRPLRWPKATDLPEGTVHAVDFGAGGISGIGPLTARNVDGCGVRVIAIGEKGQGDAEFYSVHGVNKKWTPSLAEGGVIPGPDTDPEGW
ncbi:hypothetical protein BC826DRAFT_1104312 [Russula brevipes]|nr:hypothetical protein BC826DRAFT_1104312 [Russula brevipes]